MVSTQCKDETAAKRYAVIADEMKLGGETTEEKVSNSSLTICAA